MRWDINRMALSIVEGGDLYKDMDGLAQYSVDAGYGIYNCAKAMQPTFTTTSHDANQTPGNLFSCKSSCDVTSSRIHTPDRRRSSG